MDLSAVLQQLNDAQDGSSSSEDEQLTLPTSKELLRDVGSDSDDEPSLMDDSEAPVMSTFDTPTEHDLEHQFHEEPDQVESVCGGFCAHTSSLCILSLRILR